MVGGTGSRARGRCRGSDNDTLVESTASRGFVGSHLWRGLGTPPGRSSSAAKSPDSGSAPLGFFSTGDHVLGARTEMDRLPAAKERQADVIIRDVMMRGTPGFQLQDELRQQTVTIMLAEVMAHVSRAVAVAVPG